MNSLQHDIEQVLNQWKAKGMDRVVHFETFNHYAIVHHSTTIEGSTLTETETQLLLAEGITPGGKPLLHSLMTQDHLTALQLALAHAQQKQLPTGAWLQSINAAVMRQTGSVYETPLGRVDAATGAYRKGNVRAGNSYFVNYDKVPALVTQLCSQLAVQLQTTGTSFEQLCLSFNAHFDLVSIHPFYDGNGRTARLLMNYVQAYFGLPLGIVFKEDKAAYFEALVATRASKDFEIFRNFMAGQYTRFLQQEMDRYEAASHPSKGGGFFALLA